MRFPALIALCAAACTSDPDGEPGTEPPPPPDPGWRAGASLPSPQQECGVVALDGRVFVIGGYDASITMVDTVVAYDPEADAWEAMAPLPVPLHHPNVAVLDGRIHVAGALGVGFLDMPVHYAWDPAADAWEPRAELPDDRSVGASGAAVIDGRLHLVGGLRSNRAVALHSVYDPATDAWEALPDAPSARDHLAAGAVGGKLVVTAGRTRDLGAFVPQTEIWEEGVGWSEGAPIPTPRGGVAAAVGPDGELHVLGGEGSDTYRDGVFPDHERYDPLTDTWTAEGALASPRHGTGAAWIGDTLWLPGGAPVQAFGAVDTNEGWSP
jgi:N-acetylneuraminic acid mutarotase